MKDINETLREYSAFRKRIYKYTFFIAVICGLASLPILGWSLMFLGGLAAGTCISIINFEFLAWTCKKIVYGGKGAGLSVMGYIVRLLLYGAAYYGCAKIDLLECGFGCIAGFLTIKAAIIYLHAFLGWLAERKKQKQLVEEEAGIIETEQENEEEE